MIFEDSAHKAVITATDPFLSHRAPINSIMPLILQSSQTNYERDHEHVQWISAIQHLSRIQWWQWHIYILVQICSFYQNFNHSRNCNSTKPTRIYVYCGNNWEQVERGMFIWFPKGITPKDYRWIHASLLIFICLFGFSNSLRLELLQ